MGFEGRDAIMKRAKLANNLMLVWTEIVSQMRATSKEVKTIEDHIEDKVERAMREICGFRGEEVILEVPQSWTKTFVSTTCTRVLHHWTR